MMEIKPFLLGLYLRGTGVYRTRSVRRLAREGLAPIVVPVFHRIADDQVNEWTTSRADFREAILWLRAHFELISLEEAQRRIDSPGNHRPCASITFDDGYAINGEYALPLMIDAKIPCTYFVSVQPVLHGDPFEHDRAMGKFLAPNRPSELRQLAAAGIEIGAHTRTHVDLGQVRDERQLFDEMVTSRNDLEDALGLPIRYFAFPFGQHRNLTSAAFQLAREAGYAGVCSAYGGYNFPGDDPFHIQRRCVDGTTIRLRNWASFDPLHLRRVQRFEYKPTAPPREMAVSDGVT